MSKATGRIITSLRRLNPVGCLRVSPMPPSIPEGHNDKETKMGRHETIPAAIAKVGTTTATAAISAPVVAGQSAPDAELLALGRELDRYSASVAAWSGTSDGAQVRLPHPDDILDARFTELSRAIMTTPATTFAGLAVKAKLAAFAAPTLWEEADDAADWGDLCVRSLVDAVLSAPKLS